MPNPGQPTIHPGSTGTAVKRLQRALLRTADWGLPLDGTFGPATEQSVKDFQDAAGLTADGIVGPLTWQALPDGGPMPFLKQGSTGEVVKRLQETLNLGAWSSSPIAVDGIFGPQTRNEVKALQTYGDVTADGLVGDATWGIHVGAAGATLESTVGYEFIVG